MLFRGGPPSKDLVHTGLCLESVLQARFAMSVDILDHHFVPSHEILPKKDAKTLLESLSIEKENLPRIFANDPVVKKIGAKPGDVIRIVRKSLTAGETIYYRGVV